MHLRNMLWLYDYMHMEVVWFALKELYMPCFFNERMLLLQ